MQTKCRGLSLVLKIDDEVVRAAQKQDLHNWKCNDVSQEVPDNGQCALSARCVITERTLYDKKWHQRTLGG